MSVSFSFFYFELKYKIIFEKVAASWWNIIFAMNVKSLNYYEHYGKYLPVQKQVQFLLM